jgi:hypothetical protein
MDTLRFPIGHFEAVLEPDLEMRREWIRKMAEMPAQLRHIVQSLTSEQLLTPYRPGGWTVQQVIHHLPDNDMNAYIRFKKALTEDNPIASTYKEDVWAELNDYKAPIETSLVLIESLRSRFAVLLHAMQPSDFQRTFTSPTHGVMTLDIALQRFDWHGQHHLAQISSLKERMGW